MSSIIVEVLYFVQSERLIPQYYIINNNYYIFLSAGNPMSLTFYTTPQESLNSLALENYKIGTYSQGCI